MGNKDFDFYVKVIEAFIFGSPEPVKNDIILSKLPSDIDGDKIMSELCNLYKDRGVKCVRIDDSWAFRTDPDISDILNLEKVVTKPLSRPALETLSIIAYHQPVTRTEIEDIRGVSISRGTIDLLLELGWIKPKGRRQSPGRPLTWGTTLKFLDTFGLEDLASLPGISDLKAAGLVGKRQSISDDLSNIETDQELQDTFNEKLDKNSFQ